MITLSDNNYYTVSALTKEIKRSLETAPEFSSIWVRGEITNLTYHSSGHIYFTLKDDNAVIQATFFKFANRFLKTRLKDGMSVFAFGSLSLFEKRGTYNINIQSLQPEGIGDIQKKIDELRKKLFQEGIFDQGRKRDLPFLPRTVGVVTSPTGAAVQDIIKVALKRFPDAHILIAPAKVQGDDAPSAIIRAIEVLNRPEYGVDLIIAGRGGGSFEDLLAFNDEGVVRAYAESGVPIISAVGHQIDHPLTDDAADAFAPTPSAAAELAFPIKRDLFDDINMMSARIDISLNNLISRLENRLNSVLARRIFKFPADILSPASRRLTDAETTIYSVMKDIIIQNRNRLLAVPDLTKSVRTVLENCTYRYNLTLQSLEKLSPLSTMKRGYAIVSREGSILKSVNNARPGDSVDVKLSDGVLGCTVNRITRE